MTAPPEHPHAMGVKEWFLIILLSLIWGASFFFVEKAIEAIPPLTLVLIRVGLAALALWGFVLASGQKVPRGKKTWAGLFVLGALNNVLPFGLITWGQLYIDSGTASIFNAFSPIFSALLAHFITREERLTPARALGAALGWAGVVLLIGKASMAGSRMEFMGQAAALCAALLYAVAALFGRRFKDMPPAVIAAGMLTCATLIMVPVAFILEQPTGLSHTPSAWAATAALALVSTALGYIIYFHVLARAGAFNLLLVTFLVPVSAIFLGVTLLGESLGLNEIFGMAMIFAGLWAINNRAGSRVRKTFISPPEKREGPAGKNRRPGPSGG